MGVELVWRASPRASALAAAGRVWRHALPAESPWAAALAQPAEDLREVAVVEDEDPRKLLDLLLPLAAEPESLRELARVALVKLLGDDGVEGMIDRLEAVLADVEHARRAALPRLDEELPLRIGPLREQWEGRGPGILAGIRRRTEDGVVPERARVIVVDPAGGGGGSAHARFNAVVLEGVLANPEPALPETVRLAWLVAQLQSDLPVYTERIEGDRAPRVVALATLWPTLEAAADVELLRDPAAAVARAWEFWELAEGLPAVVPQTLGLWWQTYQARRSPWGVALAALDQMLASEGA